MSGQKHAYQGSCRRERNLQAIEECPTGPGFRMRRLLIGRASQTRAHGRQVHQVILPPAHHDPGSARGEEIGKRSRIAIQSVQTSQDVGEGKRERGGRVGDHGSGTQQFPPVIAISGVSKRGEPLVRVSLEHRGSRAHDFSTLASQVLKAAETKSKRRWGAGRSLVSGSARCLAACFVPSTSTTVQWAPRRSQSPPGGEANGDRATRSRLERACAVPLQARDQELQESGKASRDEAGPLSQTAP